MSPIPAPNLNNVWLARIDAIVASNRVANVLAFEDKVGGATAAQVAQGIEGGLTTVLTAAVGTTYRGLKSSLCTLTNIHVVRYNAADPDVHDEPLVGAVFTGAEATEMLPQTVAMCVSLRTGVASRRARGRLYDYGFCIDSNNVQGFIEVAARDGVTAFWEAFRTEMSTATNFDWGVLSRGWTNEGAQDPRQTYAQAFRDITSVQVRDFTWDTMRSRSVAS